MGFFQRKKTARQTVFICNQTNILPKNFFSSLSKKTICYYLKLQIPKKHRQLFRILSQKLDYVETHCNDLNNPFHFAIRRWIFTNTLKTECFRKCCHRIAFFETISTIYNMPLIIKIFSWNIACLRFLVVIVSINVFENITIKKLLAILF